MKSVCLSCVHIYSIFSIFSKKFRSTLAYQFPSLSLFFSCSFSLFSCNFLDPIDRITPLFLYSGKLENKKWKRDLVARDTSRSLASEDKDRGNIHENVRSFSCPSPLFCLRITILIGNLTSFIFLSEKKKNWFCKLLGSWPESWTPVI